eukprot:133328_1
MNGRCLYFMLSPSNIIQHCDETEEQMQQQLLKNEFGDFPLRTIVNDVYHPDIELPSEICNEIYSYLFDNFSKDGLSYFLNIMFRNYFYSMNEINQWKQTHLIPLFIKSMSFICTIVYLFCFNNIHDDNRTDRKLIVDINNYTLSILIFVHVIFVISSAVSLQRVKDKFKIYILPRKNSINASHCAVIRQNPSILFPLIYQWLPFNYYEIFGSIQLILIPIYFLPMVLFNIFAYLYPNELACNILGWVVVAIFLIFLIPLIICITMISLGITSKHGTNSHTTIINLPTPSPTLLSFITNLCQSYVVIKKHPITLVTSLLMTIVFLIPLIICITMISLGITSKHGTNSHTTIINLPTPSPTLSPTLNPTQSPTLVPTLFPTNTPTFAPTVPPTRMPTLFPTTPTLTPTSQPTMTTPNANCKNYKNEGYSSFRVRWGAQGEHGWYTNKWSYSITMYNSQGDEALPGAYYDSYG